MKSLLVLPKLQYANFGRGPDKQKRKKRTLLGHVTTGAKRGYLYAGGLGGLIAGTLILPAMYKKSVTARNKLSILGMAGWEATKIGAVGGVAGGTLGGAVYGAKELVDRVRGRKYGFDSQDDRAVKQYGKEAFDNPKKGEILVAKKMLPGYRRTPKTFIGNTDDPNDISEIKTIYNSQTKHSARLGSTHRKLSKLEAKARNATGFWG